MSAAIYNVQGFGF